MAETEYGGRQLDTGHVSLALPQGWRVASMVIVDATLADPTAQQDEGSQPYTRNMVVTHDTVDADVDLEAYNQGQIAALEQAGVLVTHRSPQAVAMRSGGRGLLNEWVLKTAQGPRVEQMQMLTREGPVITSLTLSEQAGPAYLRVRDLFRRTLASVAARRA